MGGVGVRRWPDTLSISRPRLKARGEAARPAATAGTKAAAAAQARACEDECTSTNVCLAFLAIVSLQSVLYGIAK